MVRDRRRQWTNSGVRRNRKKARSSKTRNTRRQERTVKERVHWNGAKGRGKERAERAKERVRPRGHDDLEWRSMRGWEWHLIRRAAPAKAFCQLRTLGRKRYPANISRRVRSTRKVLYNPAVLQWNVSLITWHSDKIRHRVRLWTSVYTSFCIPCV